MNLSFRRNFPDLEILGSKQLKILHEQQIRDNLGNLVFALKIYNDLYGLAAQQLSFSIAYLTTFEFVLQLWSIAS